MPADEGADARNDDDEDDDNGGEVERFILYMFFRRPTQMHRKSKGL